MVHKGSAVVGAGATVAVGLGVFFAVSASNAEEFDAAPVTPAGHYSTVESQDFVEYVPAPEPEPIPAPEPVVVEEPAVVTPEPEPVVEQPAPAPVPAPEPAPVPVETPPANVDLGPPPYEPPGTVTPGSP